jgi:hypothetical protein
MLYTQMEVVAIESHDLFETDLFFVSLDRFKYSKNKHSFDPNYKLGCSEENERK